MATRMGCWLLLIGLSASSARAETWEIKTGAGPVFGTEFSGDRKQGLGGQAYLDLGLTELVSLSLGGGYVHHFIGSGDGFRLINAGAGVTLNLDVLVIVPFLSVRLGVLHQAVADLDPLVGLGLSVGLGADYLISDEMTCGLVLEYQGMLSDFEAFPSYLAVTLRLGYRHLD